jgi:hypothetical protein
MKRNWPVLLTALMIGLPASVDARDSRKNEKSKTQSLPALCHVRVVWTERPQQQAVVSWTTTAEGKQHLVHFDTRTRGGQAGRYARKRPADENGAYGGSGSGPYYHHARLEGLKPATTYYFLVTSDQQASREFHFTTAPATDVPFRILFGGDSRTDVSMRRKMNAFMADLAGQDPKLLALAHGGDYIVSGKDLGKWMVWLTDHELVVTKQGRLLPVIPARGNHEKSGELYDQVFATPGGGLGKNWFATRLSPQALLVTLNSETKMDGEQQRFLESTLKEAAGLRWRVAQYHEPAFGAVKGNGKAAKTWVPLFEKYNLALACEADGHCIKRTVPIRGGKHDPVGVVYIGEGGLGVPQRKPKENLWFVKPSGKVGHGHHVQRLTFDRSGLTIEALLPGGKVFDKHTIPARKR